MEQQETIPQTDDLLELRQVVRLKIFGDARIADIRRWCRVGRRMLRTSKPVVLRSMKDGRNRIMTTREWCADFRQQCDGELKQDFVVVKRSSSKTMRRLEAILG